MPARNPRPTFQMQKAAVTSVMNLSPLCLLKSHEPRASWAPVRRRMTPRIAFGRIPKSV